MKTWPKGTTMNDLWALHLKHQAERRRSAALRRAIRQIIDSTEDADAMSFAAPALASDDRRLKRMRAKP